MTLTKAQISFYRKNGYLFVPNLFPKREIQVVQREVDKLVADGKPTIPSTLAEEKAANPFLRGDVPEVAAAVGLAGHPPAQIFAEIRARKNKF